MNKNFTLSFLIVLFTLFTISQLSAAVCMSNASGLWNQNSTWLCDGMPGVPQLGDIIIIQGEHDIVLSETEDFTAGTEVHIEIYGTLNFNPPNGCTGNDCKITLDLPADSDIYVAPAGNIFVGDNGNPAHMYVKIDGITQLHGSNNGNGNDNSFPFSDGWLPHGFVPLPVELSSFYGQAMDRSNMLKWQTASEENTMVFLVERSLDGRRDFLEIGRVDAIGNSTSQRNYEMEDGNPVSLAYYRLRIVDFDGTFEFSDVIAVERSKTEIDLVEVYPIPAENEITVLVHAKAAGKAIMTLSDFMGRKIKEEKIELKAGINRYNFNWEDHETNFYYLTIYNGNERIAKKILRASTD